MQPDGFAPGLNLMRNLIYTLLVCIALPTQAASGRFWPEHPIVEPTRSGADLNFDLLIKNDQATEIVLARFELRYLDTNGRELWRGELNGGGSAPNIDLVLSRRIAPNAEQLYFNPFPHVAKGMPVSAVRVALEFSTPDGKVIPLEIETRVSTREARVIDSPLTGRLLNWDGHDELSHHRRWNHALPYLRSLGFQSNGMRYAYDLVRVDDAGALFSGDRARNESWYTFGMAVRAVADGTVVKAVGSQPDDGSFDPNRSLEDSNALFGNYLVLDIGGGTYALYAHLGKDSIRPRVGDTVKRGERIATVGKSGSAEFPHLHFQLMDSPDMRGEGLPSLFRTLTRLDGTRPAKAHSVALATGETVIAD